METFLRARLLVVSRRAEHNGSRFLIPSHLPPPPSPSRYSLPHTHAAGNRGRPIRLGRGTSGGPVVRVNYLLFMRTTKHDAVLYYIFGATSQTQNRILARHNGYFTARIYITTCIVCYMILCHIDLPQLCIITGRPHTSTVLPAVNIM